MNKYLRALAVIPTGAVKMGLLKLAHGGRFRGSALCQVSPRSEITVERGAALSIGPGFKMRDGAKLHLAYVRAERLSEERDDVLAIGEPVACGDGRDGRPVRGR